MIMNAETYTVQTINGETRVIRADALKAYAAATRQANRWFWGSLSVSDGRNRRTSRHAHNAFVMLSPVIATGDPTSEPYSL